MSEVPLQVVENSAGEVWSVNMAHIRQSNPDSGLGIRQSKPDSGLGQVKHPKTF